jgi:hypothetical protein
MKELKVKSSDAFVESDGYKTCKKLNKELREIDFKRLIHNHDEAIKKHNIVIKLHEYHIEALNKKLKLLNEYDEQIKPNGCNISKD